VRDCAAGQTAGVPIGPDSSLVVAEVILAAVDAEFKEAAGNQRGFRYLDDYELAFGSRGEAETALAKLEHALAKYELSLNPYKTEIVDLPQPYQDNWTTELAKLPIREDSARQTANDLVALYSRAAELAIAYPGALNYAVVRTREIDIARRNWPLLQSLAWGAASAEPTALARVLDLLEEKAEEADSSVSVDGAGDVLEGIIRQHAPVQNASEVAWAVWCAISLGIPLSRDAAKAIATIEDDVVALLALDARSRELFVPGALDDSNWERLVSEPDALQGNHWLLAYEGSAQGWLTEAGDHVAKDRFFNAISGLGIRFYDGEAEHEPFTGPTAPLPGQIESYG
jgi:hypothetical protein